jgi:23S rRNA pseudouridine1911/1915/1917 synthase
MQKFYTHKIKINKEQNLARLDQALAKLLDKVTRSQIKILLQNHNIRKADNIITEASQKVKEGEVYSVSIPIIQQTSYQPENIPLDIKYEDENIIIVNKIAGMVTHPAPGNQHGTLVHALLNHTSDKLSSINKNNRPGIVHRLDKDTSGLIIVAKDNFTHLHLSEQFKNHSISRKYQAIVWGIPKNKMIEGYIERNKINRKKMTLNQNKGGKFSQTIITLKKNFGICSIVECLLKTGRTHQIRLHMTSISNPIVGDKLYGKNKINKFGKNKETFNKFLILKNFKRQALHAYHIGFTHPFTKKYLEFESKFPQDLKNLLDLLVKY